MIHTIEFGTLSTMLIDFVDSGDGLLYLRMAGNEATVNAVWAVLSSKEHRSKKWSSPVKIPVPGQAYTKGVALQKGVVYKTLRTRLPSGMIDLALLHPRLTVAEDAPSGFYLLTYDEDIPVGFFERLNASLSIPLKAQWEVWLWEQGQRPQTRQALKTNTVWEDRQRVEKTELAESLETPIQRLDSLGQVICYSVHCDGSYRTAWLQIIRAQLDLGIRLAMDPYIGESDGYGNDTWAIVPVSLSDQEGWRLYHLPDEEALLEAPNLPYLLAEARDSLGLPFLLEEGEPC